MPRRYRTSLNLAKLNAQIYGQTSDNESDIGDESAEDEESRYGIRQLLDVTPHFSHIAGNTGMLGQQLQEENEQIFPDCLLTMPLPLFLPKDGHTPRSEPCLKRPQAHDEWMLQLNIFRTQFERRTKKLKQREMKHQLNIHDVSLFDMAEHIAGQENGFFRDSFDYYYTGGNLNLMPFHDDYLAMHVSGPKLNDLHFSRVNNEADIWRPLHSEKLEQATSEILELQPLESFRVNHGHMFLARHLNEVSLYELKREMDDEEEQYGLVCQSKFTSQGAPFISVAQSRGNVNNLALACQDRSIRFLDIVTQQDIAKHDVCMLKGLQTSTSTWAQLLPAEGRTFHYLSQPVLLTVDERCDQPLNPCFASSVHTQNCETFSCMTKSVNPNLLYVASNHKLHCLDLRCLGKKLTDRAVVSWTHQMTYSPCMMDTFAYEGSEYIALGGVMPSDQRICELKGALAKCVDEMFSPAMPYAPPTLEEALSEARVRGYVDIYADLTERVKACITGLRFHRPEEPSDHAFAQLLTSTSLGDVYCQRLTLRDAEEHVHEMRTGLHTAEAMRYYGDFVREEVELQKLHCTEVQRIPEMRDIFREAAKRTEEEEEKPHIVEDIEIDYGIEDTDLSDNESQDSQDSPEPGTSTKKKLENKKKKKAKKKQQEVPKQINPATNPKKDKGINRGSWQKSAFKLARYTDMMSVQLLDAWDMEEYDQTRDVTRDMLQERLHDEYQEPERLMASWLDQLPTIQAVDHHEDEDENGPLVPGTNLPKVYGATSAEFREISNHELEESTFDISMVPPLISPKKETPVGMLKRQFSTLLPNQSTVIETTFPIPTNPTPTKRPKTKHVKGF
ncbi:hypothetical protein KR009_008725 [Drosophila setifemur]|nr:hypothetical protein KR009_008725 [Drosophila setifemur]